MRREPVVAACAVVAFALLLLVWGTGGGTPLLSAPSGVRGLGGLDPPAGPAGEVGTPSPVPTLDGEGRELPVDWVVILVSVVLVAMFVGLLRYVLGRVWDEDDHAEVHEGDEEWDLLMRATSEQTRLAALAEGDPRNAVVACWVALEDAADGAGLARDAAETSAEFTQRVLAGWQIDRGTVTQLAELYREARFSAHPVSELMRAEAVQALKTIHDHLRSARSHPQR